jgi:hypothetical protein
MKFKVQIEHTVQSLIEVDTDFAEDAITLALKEWRQVNKDANPDFASVFDPDDEVGFAPPLIETSNFKDF